MVLNQIAQVSDRDPGDISLINVVTMLCSIVTLPGTIWVYERLVAPF